MKKFEDLCSEIYQEFIREITLNPDFVVYLKDADNKTIEKFKNHFQSKINKSSLGAAFVVYYCEYQFNYWRDMKTKFGKNVIYFSWIFGKKAIVRYDEYHSKIFSRNIRQDIGQKILAKFTQAKRSVDFFLKINNVEEGEKHRFLNKEEGLMWCVQNTSLYNNLSKNCLMCLSAINCKEILKNNFPKLYKKRKLE